MIYLNEARAKLQGGDREAALLRVNAARFLARSRAEKNPARADAVSNLESVQTLHREILEQSGDIGGLIKIHREHLDLLHRLKSDVGGAVLASEPLERAEASALVLADGLMALSRERLSEGKMEDTLFLLFMSNELSETVWKGTTPNPAAGFSLANGKWILGQILSASEKEDEAKSLFDEALELLDRVQAIAPDFESVGELRGHLRRKLAGENPGED